MTLLAASVLVLLLLLFALQAVPTWAFARRLRRAPTPPLADAECPTALVVLCLRGSDPFLERCLTGLLEQDYPNFHLRIIVDQRQDPAWQVVEDVLARQRAIHVSVEPLVERYETCSLKCSSLIQALTDLDEEYEVVALLDGDTLPHPSWLRELVAPLRDERVGVSSGNRWYMPQDAGWGSLVRYFWNAAAVVQMYWNRFTWGGSVALRAEIFRQGDLLASWKTSVSTDTVIYNVIRRHGYQTAFVPSLMMVNREACALPNFFRWVQRQMVVARLYHPGWPVVFTHGLVTTLVLAAAFAGLAGSLALGVSSAAVALAGGLTAYLLGMIALFALLEHAVRRVVRARSEATSRLRLPMLLKALLAIPLTQFVYAAALLKVTRLRRVEWRGVTYTIEGPRRVRMVEYQPYEQREADALASL